MSKTENYLLADNARHTSKEYLIPIPPKRTRLALLHVSCFTTDGSAKNDSGRKQARASRLSDISPYSVSVNMCDDPLLSLRNIDDRTALTLVFTIASILANRF